VIPIAESLSFLVLGRGDASDLERLSLAVDRLAEKLQGLDRVRAEPEVDVDTRRAEAKVGAFAENLQRRIRRAVESLPDIELDANATDADRAIAEIRGELAALSDKKIGVDINTEEARVQVAALEERLRALDTADANVSVRADVATALAQLQAVVGEVDRLDGRTARVKVDVDRGLGDSIVKVAALGRALSLLALPAAAVAVAPTLVALGSAAVTAAGAVGVLPGALLGAVGAFATFKVGLSGVGDALKELDKAQAAAGGTAKQQEAANKKLAESLKNLAPAARDFVVEIKKISPAWNSVRLDVQQRLFAGLGAEMGKLSSAYLPTVRSGLGGLATELNSLAKDFVGFATAPRTIQNVDGIFRNITASLQAARPAVTNFAAAFLDIGVVGSQLLPELAGELTDASARFRTFIDQARRSGELKTWIQDGIDTIKTLGSITVNVGATLLHVFDAQKTAGVSLLDTLDRLTGAMRTWTGSAEGQRVLVAVFSEIRRTIDAIAPGLKTLLTGVMQMLAALANTGGLVAFGAAFTAVAQAIAPLLPLLGEIVGVALGALSDALTGVANAAAPIIAAFSGLMGALGPVPGAVLGMVAAFKLLGPVNTIITNLGTSLAGMATKVGASETAAGRISKAFSAIGSAVPIVGAAVVGLAAVWDALTISTDEAARAMDAGGAAAQEAAAGLAAQTAAMDALKNSSGPLGDVLRTLGNVMGLFTSTTEQARAAMTPLQQAQLDAATAANVHRIAVEQFGASSPQAASAAEALASANDKLAAEQGKAKDAAKTHADAVRDLGSAMQTQIGTALAYEDAVKRTADAHKAANDELKKSGANSDDYKAKVLDLARAQEQQAQSAQRAVEAQLTGADAQVKARAGLEAYNRELLRLNDGTQAGRDAFVKLASNLDNSGLAALSASAQMTGLRTEILTLPDGRKVTIVTSADTGSIEAYKATINDVVAQTYVGTVTVVGDPTQVNNTLQQVVQFANGQQGTITLNGNSQPVQAVLGATKYNIDATTGVLTIDGNPAPGEANLTGLKLRIDQTTGTITLEGNPAPAQSAITGLEQPTQSTHTVEGNPGPAQGAITGLEQPTQSTHTVNPDAAPAQGAIDALKAPTSSTHTINVDAGAVNAAKAAAQTPTASIHTLNVDPGPVLAAKANAQQPTQSLHTLNCDDRAVVDAKNRAQQPTQSMHTIHCNDSEVTSAKSRAQQNTSSTHTIHVVVVGDAPPRAAGAYTTPGRAAGAYAARMAAGGMRRMSAARAEIVPPRQPRIIGDRMRGDEAFIPINRSARSIAILNQAANGMGFDVVPRMSASASAVQSMRDSIGPVMTGPRGSGGDSGLLTELRKLNGQLGALRGDVDHHGDNATIAAELRALRAQLGRGRGGSATADAQRNRTTAELGAF